MFSRVKGTQDFLDLTLYNFITDRARSHFALYNFHEIATPILEPVSLFKRSLGSHTDVVSKEMFIIKSEHESEDDAICLRPEATASIARAFIENSVTDIPWKVFTQGPMFRHERPQKGRYRQFHQMSIEIIGSASVMQDANFITMLDRYFHEKLQTNNYALMLNYLGCAADRAAYNQKLKNFLDSLGDKICPQCHIRKEKNILRVFDCKVETCQALYENAPYITDNLCAPCAAEWQSLQNELELLSVSFVHNPKLVRGLDYYNKTVFEFVSNALGAQSAFCGGGRYDTLISLLGGKQDQPSIGAAFGIERIMLMLEQIKDTLPLPALPALNVIMPLSPAQQPIALLLADQLLAAQLVTEVLLEGDSIKSMMRHANKLGAKYCLLLGDDEQATNTVTIKNMVNGTQERIAQADAVRYLKG